MTTPLPGLRLVLMYGATESPLFTALRASSPAPNITEGLDVLVQLVIAEITTEPVRVWRCESAEVRGCVGVEVCCKAGDKCYVITSLTTDTRMSYDMSTCYSST